jgi:hypothetical protein
MGFTEEGRFGRIAWISRAILWPLDSEGFDHKRMPEQMKEILTQKQTGWL